MQLYCPAVKRENNISKNSIKIQCPVCGFYCLGKGGFSCSNKPELIGSTTWKIQC